MSDDKLLIGAIVKLRLDNLSQESKDMYLYRGITADSRGVVIFNDGKLYRVVWETPRGRMPLDAEYRYGMRSGEITPTGKYVSQALMDNLIKEDHMPYLEDGLKDDTNIKDTAPVSKYRVSALRANFENLGGGKRGRKSRKYRKVRKSRKVLKSRKVRKSRRRSRR